jgi:hypothetical protein
VNRKGMGRVVVAVVVVKMAAVRRREWRRDWDAAWEVEASEESWAVMGLYV